MYQSDNKKVRKRWFLLSIIINLGFLGVFKYYNFFVSSFAEGLSNIGFSTNFTLLNIILPVGISFYTFHGLSYVIDIYNKRIHAERNFVDYAVFVSFFPLLVAGPIERATHLLPQLKKQRNFRYTSGINGIQQIFWGLFKKIVVADNCAPIANTIFDNYQFQNSITLIGGAVLFAIQIYGDFSGYSDIAIGGSRLFGINLIRNFNYPYFSRDIAEFWRRWHISLTTWFRDYLYIPLGGSRVSKWKVVRNTFIIFLVSGFWHGANWTFMVWGAYHALLFLPLIITGQNRKYLQIVGANKILPSFKEFFQIILTFILVAFGWIFFRATSLTQSLDYVRRIFLNQNQTNFSFFIHNEMGITSFTVIFAIFFSIIMIIIEWIYRKKRYGFEINTNHWIVRVLIIIILIIVIYLCHGNPAAFIYFQF